MANQRNTFVSNERIMEIITHYHSIAGTTIARIFLGCLFLFQGYDAIFGIGIKKVVATYKEGFQQKRIPGFLITLAALFTSYTELIGGVLLLFGLFHYPVLYLLGINLIVAAIGFGLTTPLWDTRYVLPRLLLLLLLLLLPPEWNAWSIDKWLF
jgi:putative oxidoreductase